MISFFLLIGLLTGGIMGFTGASGVLILVPLLTIFTDWPLYVILGTSLTVDVLASISVTFSYMKNKNIAIYRAFWLLIGSLFGAQIGSFFFVNVSKLLIVIILALCVLFFGINLLRFGKGALRSDLILIPEKYFIYFQNPFIMIFLGILVGISTGLLGAGGGITIFIILYSLLRLPIKIAIGTSTFVMLLTALSGVIGYVEYNNFDFKNGIIIGVFAAFAGAISAKFANKISDFKLARVIGVFFICLAILMIVFKIFSTLFFI